MARSNDRPTRRQARGKRRIASILDAAADVFAEVGFEAATTNAIATRAGISPGSLYQYFSNKEDIAAALTERFTQRLRSARADDDVAELSNLPLEDAIDHLVDPLIAFYLVHPGFLALATGTDQSPRLATVTKDFHQGVVNRADAILAAHLPRMAPDTRQRYARVSVQLVWSLLALVKASELHEREAMVAELKTVIVRYLAPVWKDSARQQMDEERRS